MPADRVWGARALETSPLGAWGPRAPLLGTPGLACRILELAGILGEVEGLPVLSGVP